MLGRRAKRNHVKNRHVRLAQGPDVRWRQKLDMIAANSETMQDRIHASACRGCVVWKQKAAPINSTEPMRADQR